MVSKEHKRAVLCEKLQLLRSITNSHASSKSSIIIDASKYIEELKQKVDTLNQEIAFVQSPAGSDPSAMQQVKVETLEKGFLITVFSAKSCSGLLVSILEAFEELGLTVMEARISCADSFSLEAVGGENQEALESLDAEVVKQAVLQAINNCNIGSSDQDCK